MSDRHVASLLVFTIIARLNTITDDLNQRTGACVRIEREERGWSLNTLAERAGASWAMIHKIKHGASRPTSTMLARLSGAFGMSMSTLIARAELQEGNLRPRGMSCNACSQSRTFSAFGLCVIQL
ncbi:helix-turn-helix transcriptional regulator [Enterobacteriaceae bacterium YMB-R22]|nr:helix-turn-helix transcriptional regulator [Tenebrionicola larvae]